MKNVHMLLYRTLMLCVCSLLTFSSFAFSSISDINVSGKVVDNNSEPLVGVSIRVEGTDKGTITDVDGNYSLTCPSNATLVFSFVGFADQKVAVNNQSVVNVTLAASASALNEVVVVGYGQSSRKTLTSAVTTMKPEDLNRGAISDVGQLLQGKVPGLNISASGDPNRPAAVVLRGASTLNSSQGPFYVIDNVPGADISTIAPDDIATIDVLKDAAATAIYGNRAANGVIMITTKKGKKGQGVVSYNGFVGTETVASRLEMMNSTELKAFLAANGQSMTPANDKGADTDWQKAVQRSKALSHNHNLSFSGGGEHHSYSASLNYMNKEGILLESNFQRVIARLQFDQSLLNDKVKLGMQVSNATTKSDYTPQRNSVLGQMITYLPTSPVKNPDGSFFENFTTSGYFNPVAMIEHGQDQTKFNNLIGSVTAQVQLPFGLSYNLNVSHQKSTSLHGEFYGSYYSQYNSANFYYKPEPPAVHYLQNFGTNGSAVRNTYENTNNILETFLTWNKEFGSHYLKAVVGYSWQDNTIGDGFQVTSTNFPVDNIGFNNFALSNPYAITSYRINFGGDGIYQQNRLISDFARLNYNFKDKYLLQGSIRRDGSSVFGKNNQWGYFPSVGAAWRISEEGFMKNQSLFDDLKLRASYGITGNSSGFNAYTALFLSGSLGSFYNNGTLVAALGPTKAANADLQWEKTTTQNLGLDFSILKGKINGTLELYDKTTSGMIYSYGVDRALVPAGSIVANGGSMNNRGVELSINITPLSTKSFSWTSGINLASNTNKIVSLSNPLFAGGDSVRLTQPEGSGQTGSTLQILKAGYPLGQFFSFNYAGKDANGVSQYYKKNGELTTTPAIGADYHYVGSPQPKLLLGWTNTMRFNNFDLNFFIRGVFGNKIFNATRADLFRPTTAQFTNILKDVASESAKDVNSQRYSSRFVEDGSYVRMDNATLGYTINGISKYMKSVRIYAAVNNAFTWTKYNGIDPEVNQGGIAPGVDTNNFYPKTRTLMLGLNTSF
ncbi:MAG: TonB-dependent receptor [Saprospiraceae bacterium]|nr:TonB-dependent receptor [Saprospiraceae bacterium]